MIGLMVLFGGAMAFALLYNVIQSNLAERSVEVATLRAAGMPFATLARMITLENAVVAAIGIIPGCLIAYELAVSSCPSSRPTGSASASMRARRPSSSPRWRSWPWRCSRSFPA